MKQKVTFTIFSTLLFLASACTKLQEFPFQGEFDGVRSSLDRGHSVSIFVTHGLGGFSQGDPDALIDAIKNSLNLCQTGECVREITNSGAQCDKSYGFLKRIDYATCNPAINVKIYVLDWRQSTVEAKCDLKYIDQKYFASLNHAQPFLKTMKENVVDEGLADAVLYLSNYRKEIQFPFAQSLRWIYEDNKYDSCHEMVFVGFSLGSLVLIDTIDCMLANSGCWTNDPISNSAAQMFVNDLSSFFMLSNTYPIFHLSEIYPKNHLYQFNDHQACCDNFNFDHLSPLQTKCCMTLWNWQETALGRFVFEKRRQMPDFQIIAVTDPNDPLSYYVEDYFTSTDCYAKNIFLNEEVRNAKYALFGYVNPIDAHTGYGKNSKVLSMIVFGVKNQICQICDPVR